MYIEDIIEFQHFYMERLLMRDMYLIYICTAVTEYWQIILIEEIRQINISDIYIYQIDNV